uniref:WxxW domain-containing protein n=1 Tax=Ciona intestinalis TaxID=7719 RepID=F6T5Q7_CIOIN
NFFWTKWYNTDDPDSDDGDKELLRTVLLRQRTMVCETPTGIQARVVQGNCGFITRDLFSSHTPNLGLICYNNEQTDGRCKDYRVRYCCSPGVGRCPLRYGWSPFFDHSNTSAYGDSEVLEQLRVSYPGRICETPVAIGAETTAGKPYQSSGNKVKISPTFGLQCRNSDQINIRCNDFKVRFCCSACYYGFWTQWYNSDSPGHGSLGGDSETLAHVLSSYRTRVCRIPTGIQARIASNDLPYGRANQTLLITPLTGLICLNKDQDNGQCRDYKVRYCCSDAVGLCPLRHGWTQFFDNDDPRGFGDFELLSRIKRQNPGRVCSTPVAISARLLDGKPYQEGGNILQLSPSIGLSCFNFQQGRRNRCKDYQVRFCCSGFCPNRRMWTRWFDTRNSEGDLEHIDRIRQTRPSFCPNPMAVRAQVSNTHRSFYTGGDQVRLLPNVGLICRNSEQRNNKSCSNYRVKFCCSTNLIEVTLAPRMALVV